MSAEKEPGFAKPGSLNNSQPTRKGTGTNSTEPAIPMPDPPPCVTIYPYPDENGRPLFRVKRREPGTDGRSKSFTQQRYVKDFGWTNGVKGVRRVLYRLPEVIAAVKAGRPIVLCEGEKDVDELVRLGYVATCNAGGAGKWKPEYSETLRGADVTIWADDDDAGMSHARMVHDGLIGKAKSIRVVKAKFGKDAYDHFAAGHTLSDAVPVPPSALPPPTPAGRAAPPSAESALVMSAVLARVLGVLAAGGPTSPPPQPGGDYAVCCPVHDDATPSATVKAGSDRPVIFCCHRGCTQEQFIAAMVEAGIPLADLMDTKRPIASKELVAEVERCMSSLDASADDFYDELMTEDDMMRLPDPDYVVGQWFERGGYSVVYGDAGVGKTALLVSLAKSTSLGVPWMDCRTVRGAVLFMTGEGKNQIQARLKANGVSKKGDPIRFYETKDLSTSHGVAATVATVRRMELELGVKVQLIVVDPLMEYMSSDEIGEGMHLASRGLRALAILTETAVVVNHHTNAGGEKERGNKVLRQRALGMTFANKWNDAGDVDLIQDKLKNAREYAFRLSRRTGVDGIAFDLMDSMPRDEYSAERERMNASARDRKKQEEAEAEYDDMKPKLLSALRSRSAGMSESGLCKREMQGQGYGEQKFRASLHRMVRDGLVVVDGEGAGALYKAK